VRLGILVEQALAPVPGGTGRYAVELAAALARSAGPGDAVTGWTAWHRDVVAATVPGVAGPRRLALPRRALTLAWERGFGPRVRDADVLHAPTPLFGPSRVPLVVTIHDAVPWTHPETLTPRGVRWHRAMAQRAVERASAIAVPTHAVAAELGAALRGLGRVEVLGAGVAPTLLAEPPVALADHVAKGLPDGFVLSLATLEPRKGLDVLVAALGRLGAAAPPMVVVGQPGWGGVDLDSAARAAGLAPGGVTVLGRVRDEELAVILRRATMLVAPSRAEGFGLPVAEAMALGTPVICSDAPALVEVAAGAAVVVPRDDAGALADAVSSLLADDSERRRLRAAGLVRAADFTWDSVADRAWQLYRDLR